MKKVISKYPRMLHGGDYNPDQWLDYPEVLAEDIRLMKEANVNCVSLGIFAWAKLEPEEGRYELDWMEQIINNLYENGVYTLLATPSGAMPHWMTNKYEEVRQVRSNGVRNLPGSRHNFCPTSPVVRTKMKAINRKLSERFGKHPGVILWHVSNEYGNNGGDGYCYCEKCQEAFRQWLKEKYKTLDALNHAWWANFWSHTYTDWSQIQAPVPNGENSIHGLKLDWKRFMTHQIMDFCQEEIDAVREFSDVPATVNMMDLFEPYDYFKFAKIVDIVSWDSYPEWHTREDEVYEAVKEAANHSLMRSLKRAPFLMMESTPSIVNWKNINTQKRPGFHELASLHAIAHGSNSVQYFQWRKSRGSAEKFHGAVVDHRNGSNTRVFREVSKLGERLGRITDQIYSTCNKPKAAILFDWDNRWILDEIQGPRKNMGYVETMLAHFKAFWELGIDVDFVDEDCSLDGYALVAAPLSYMYKPGYAERVREFVKNGGTYVSTYFSGVVDETDLCIREGHPLADVLGIRTEEIDAAGEHLRCTMQYGGKNWQLGCLREVAYAEVDENGNVPQILSVYDNDYYKGFPALTCKQFGEGKAYYLACEVEEGFLTAFYEQLTADLGIQSEFTGKIPYAVEVSRRDGEQPIWFLQNYNAKEVEMEIPFAAVTVPDGEEVGGKVVLAPYECLIVTTK